MNLYEYHTVQNMVKHYAHEEYKTPNPFDWLWCYECGIWQPIRRK